MIRSNEAAAVLFRWGQGPLFATVSTCPFCLPAWVSAAIYDPGDAAVS